MKVVSVIASPRKNGNSSSIVKKITDVIVENDGTNNTYYVNELNISPCMACKACKNLEKPTKCIIDDDFIKIMDEVDKADLFIFAAPNYFGEINTLGHLFMERFYSMTKTTPNRLDGSTKCIVVHTYGANYGRYDEYINKRANRFRSIGLDVVEVLSVGKNDPTSNTPTSKALLEKCEEIAKRVLL